MRLTVSSTQAFETTFEQIERLRDLMLSYLKAERRDFQPIFDVYVMGSCLQHTRPCALSLTPP